MCGIYRVKAVIGGIFMKGFINFIREQGVVGLAVGFILGGAVSKVVTALVTDLINPLVGILLGFAGNLSAMTLKLGPAVIKWGDFLSVLIDFLIIAAVVYYGVKGLGLDKLDKKKS
jgi:large conductance mechanosensitive channel